MANTFSDDLAELYQGEIIGEVLTDRMLTFFDKPTERHKIATIMQLETETKARLRPALLELGVSLVELEESRAAGLAFAASLQGLGWRDAMIGLRDGIKPYLERYREFAANAPDAFKPIAQSMVRHEASIYRFTELELAGDSAHSLDDIVAQLTYPLPAPAQ